MADAVVEVVGSVSRPLPQLQLDNVVTNDPLRVTPYRDAYVASIFTGKQLLAEEGTYLYATNPTIGTAVAHALTTAFSQTAALFVLKNNHATKYLHLDFLKLTITGTVPGTKLTEEILVQVDNANRVPTAGLALFTPVPTKFSDGPVPVQGYSFSAGALTVPTGANTARVVSRGKLPLNVAIAHDVYTFQFGAADYTQIAPPLTAVRAVQAGSFVAFCAPAVAAPGEYLVIYRWGATEATTAPSYEWELGMILR